MIRIGSLVGHFRVVGVLGRGGMGEVYEGFDETLRRRVALKTIRSDRRLDESSRKRFLREAQMLSQLDHPSICRIHDYVEWEECDLLVLELIEGRTLRDAIRGGELDFRGKLRVAEAIAGALAAAHRLGIVHRDLKPDNVMLTTEGAVKVLDFGLARTTLVPSAEAVAEPNAPPDSEPPEEEEEEDETDADTLFLKRRTPSGPFLASTETRAGETVGTPAYMSPEQARGETLTTASDMYSFGLVLQALFTGRAPYEKWLTPGLIMQRAARGESLPPAGADRDVAELICELKVMAPSDRPTALDALNRLRWIGNRTRRAIQRVAAAALLLLALAAGLKYVTDVRRERNVAIAARAEAERRRAQAEGLIGFMVGDLRTKLEPVGRLDVLDDVGAQALRYFRSLRPEEFSPAELRRNAKTLSQLGEVRMAQGNLAAAEEVLQSSLSLAAAAAERDPADGQNQIELGASHFWMGSLRRQQGDLGGALEHYRSYLRISEALAVRHPANADYQLEVGYGHSNVGTILEQRGELEGALEHYRRAVAIKERRLATDPGRADWNADLATTVNKVGVVLLSLGRYGEAETALRREHDLLASALRAEPKNNRWRQRLAVNANFQGRLAEETGAEDAAFAHYSREREIETGLVSHDETNTNWQRDLAVCDTNLARLLHHRGDLAGAEASYRRALARLEPLRRKDPGRVLWMRDVATLHDGLATLLRARGRAAAARGEVDAARAALAGAPPTEVDTRRLAWQVAITSGAVAARQGDARTAEREWQSVIDGLWPSRQSIRNVREIDLLARALLHRGRVDDGAPLVERLKQAGYRKRPLMTLWESRAGQPANRA